ncbi:MAG: AAA family ATPase [Myxococcales bacterium]|nr:AAA family ATPase [Myxococcales bacterium]
MVDGVMLGALVCGGYMPEDQDASGLGVVCEHLPRMSPREILFMEDLLEEAAAEISAFLIGAGKIGGRSSEGELRASYQSIIGVSQPMQALYSLLDRVVTSDSTVLITGENGTGKELVAKAIHAKSHRKNRRFVAQNCSAFNDNLLDSELFGHNRGAFTGAVADKKGLFEIAHEGTFFLDEIGDMSSSLQVKVLRVLQEGTFIPVGGTETKQVDVRIVAATNRDLKTMVEEGTFREDLYYRINVINLRLPPLRERIDDLEILVRHFLEKHDGCEKRLSTECDSLLRGYAWPGNVRELENEIERLVVLSGSSPLFAAELLSERMRNNQVGSGANFPAEPTNSLPDAVKALEKRMIHAALVEHDWNKTRAAAQLQVSRRNLIRLVQKYELE